MSDCNGVWVKMWDLTCASRLYWKLKIEYCRQVTHFPWLCHILEIPYTFFVNDQCSFQEPLGCCQLFVCDLLRSINSKDLTNYFGQYGEILGIDRPKRSYCFITYANPSSVSKVMKVGKVIGVDGKVWHLINDRYVECQQKMDRSQVCNTFIDCLFSYDIPYDIMTKIVMTIW